MQQFRFRPWGRPTWLKAQYKQDAWAYIACHSTEKRSAKSIVNSTSEADRVYFVRIDDPLVGQAEEQDERTKSYKWNADFVEENCSAELMPIRESLKASLDTVKKICNDAASFSGNVVLDITSFPKRWFFPMVRFLVEDDSVANLKITYTKGELHASTLSENPELLRVLPTFISDDQRSHHDFAFVGVGFHTHSMLKLFDDDSATSLQLLFPFPPGPPGIHRNWRFVQEVEMKVQKDERPQEGYDAISYLHLDSVDVSQTFDAIKITTEGGQKTSVMAPYGPKPFSLAMCLFAIASERAQMKDVPVYYSQPQKYAINYTNDAASRGGLVDAWAYAIKKSGSYLYEL